MIGVFSFDTHSKIPSTAKPDTPSVVKSKLAQQMKSKAEDKKEEEKPVQGIRGVARCSRPCF
jgi:hypothetical protein